MRKTNDHVNFEIKKMYILLDAKKASELFDKYFEEDQRIITSRIEDYHDPKLIINKVHNLLEKIDARHLTREEQIERRHILWLWYHHAISYAVWGYKDKKRAKKYSALALRNQPKNHPNKITRLLYLLVRDKYEEAKEWVKSISKEEKSTAKKLLLFYKEGGFFK